MFHVDMVLVMGFLVHSNDPLDTGIHMTDRLVLIRWTPVRSNDQLHSLHVEL